MRGRSVIDKKQQLYDYITNHEPFKSFALVDNIALSRSRDVRMYGSKPPTRIVMTEALPESSDATSAITRAILDFIAYLPQTSEATATDPEGRSRTIANIAALKAATTAGTLAIPPGPIGWLTILPELVIVWKIQAQMVSDIASAYGKRAALTQGQMVYCLFRHLTSQVAKDIVIRVGERYVVKRTSLRMLQKIAQAVTIKTTQRAIKQGIARWVPIVGALGVAGYAFYDTGEVAANAMNLFSKDIEIEEPDDVQSGESCPQ